MAANSTLVPITTAKSLVIGASSAAAFRTVGASLYQPFRCHFRVGGIVRAWAGGTSAVSTANGFVLGPSVVYRMTFTQPDDLWVFSSNTTRSLYVIGSLQ